MAEELVKCTVVDIANMQAAFNVFLFYVVAQPLAQPIVFSTVG